MSGPRACTNVLTLYFTLHGLGGAFLVVRDDHHQQQQQTSKTTTSGTLCDVRSLFENYTTAARVYLFIPTSIIACAVIPLYCLVFCRGIIYQLFHQIYPCTETSKTNNELRQHRSFAESASNHVENRCISQVTYPRGQGVEDDESSFEECPPTVSEFWCVRSHWTTIQYIKHNAAKSVAMRP